MTAKKPNRSSRTAVRKLGDKLDQASLHLRKPFVGSNKSLIAIEMIDLGTLKPDPKNARKHSRQQIRKLERDIRKHGFINPLLVTRHGEIIAGHARLEAAKLAQLSEIPVIRLDVTKAEAKLRNVWDNKSSDLSHFDNGLLAETMVELIKLDVDIEETGFSVGECDILVQGLSELCEDQADMLPPPGASVSKSGELWWCDDHRVFCGDAEQAISYETLMNGQQAHAAFTDVPYNRNGRDIYGNGKVGPRPFQMASGEMPPERYGEFVAGCMKLMAAHSVNGALHFHCIDWRHFLALQTAAAGIYSDLLNVCVWVKPNGGMGSLYRSRHELVMVFKSGKGRHRNNIELGRHGRYRTNVWEYAGGTTRAGRITEEGNLLDLHPTVKPVQMVADALLDCTAPKDIVLDPFLGSGSTLIAAERTGRTCYGMEINPLYVDTCIRRWQRHTGQHAIRAIDGRRFDDVEGGEHG